MYYYLDKDDGYSKGPYSWEELKRLPLLPDTYIFNKRRREWRPLSRYQDLMEAQAAAAVKPLPRNKHFVAEKEAPAHTPRRPHLPEPKQPEPHTKLPFPLPLPQQGKAVPAMGVSGAGCFVMAVLLALLVIGVILLVGK